MPPWLTDLLAQLASSHPDWDSFTYATQRRLAIKARWPAAQQWEAMQDQLNGRTDSTKWSDMNADIAAIKTALPKSS